MKNKILALTASLASLAALASPAKAGDRGDKVAAAVGGFIGGVILGSSIEHNRHPAVVYAPPPAPYCPPAPVVYAPPPPPCPPALVGYWREVPDRVWVPERWVVSFDTYGRRVRTCSPGYYEARTRRVWVDAPHGHGGYAYGYSGRR